MTPFERYYQRKLKGRKPVFPQRTMVEEREAEGQRAPLWDKPNPGRQISARNILRDAGATVVDFQQQPSSALANLRSRLRSYLSSGPNIDRPVPLTRNPWRNRR